MGDIPSESQPLGDAKRAASIAGNYGGRPLKSAFYGVGDAQNITHGTVDYQSMPMSYPNMYPYPVQVQQETFNMNTLGLALPDQYQVYTSPPQRLHGGSSLLPHQHQMNHHFGNPANLSQEMQNPPYNMQYQTQYQGIYSPGHNQAILGNAPGANISNSYFQGQQFMAQPHQQTPTYLVQAAQYRGHSQTYTSHKLLNQPSVKGAYPGENGHQIGVIEPTRSDYAGTTQPQVSEIPPGSISSSTTQSSVVRGPPRKPRQSGHAIWIGNLPPHTDLMSLVLHVCKETAGLESLFLISKSNCAFANYKDETACAAAQMKIHDSRFQTVRLVSRLRRSSAGSVKGIPTGPAALNPPSLPVAASIPLVHGDVHTSETNAELPGTHLPEEIPTTLRQDKYFVVKSLTVEDLELSVRNGIWATQSHNEDTLNQAFQNAQNVYLIFSANKFGEYFGYAKMISPINNDPAAAIEFAPKAHTMEDQELPKAIPTSATEFAPNGRIIDDSARGTIFWEAECEEVDGVEEGDADDARSEDDSGASSKKAWGKPFNIEWISTNRLPFYRTRGLRNPWNSNREVKIARDGTELETTVGERLIRLFHQVPAPLQQGVHVAASYPQTHPYP